MKWQPIEAAPKDVEILTYTPKEAVRIGVICGIHVGYWSHVFDKWTQSDMEWELAPTHWMPLPEPPE